MTTRKPQPNSKMCFICGLENPVGLKLRIYEVESGVVESMFTAPEHFQGYPGVMHGGIVATIIDEISGRALMGPVENPRFMFTAKLEVKYHKNVPIGKPLRIVGKAGQDKGRSAESWAGIYEAETGELLAEGNTLLVNVPQDRLEIANLEEMGWKVYPEG
ncbi:MAG: PaaI family thioesterase [Anaerolineaceae bacterium]|nr:PaaI family thioesterase [Anaerolineaceae bacterium]